MVVEVLGGIFSGSLALLADAGHMLTDAASIALALVAVWIAGRLESIERTFGYQRTEVLAAAFVLHSGSKHSLNVDGAFKHVLADLMGSVGVVISGVVVILTDWVLIDLILSIGIALLNRHQFLAPGVEVGQRAAGRSAGTH